MGFIAVGAQLSQIVEVRKVVSVCDGAIVHGHCGVAIRL